VLDRAAASFHRGTAYINVATTLLGQVDAAIACFKKAIALDPKSAQAHRALGQALLGKGRYAEARDASAQARSLLPANHPLRAIVSRQLQECRRLLMLEPRLMMFDEVTSALDPELVVEVERMMVELAEQFRAV